MERKISFADVQKAVDEAFEQFKSDKDGAIDPRVQAVSKAGAFGISVVLTDGRSVDKGDADSLFVLGPIVKLPLSVVLLTQNKPEELVRKSGHCLCGCHRHKHADLDLPFGLHGLRAVSAVQPVGDREGKMGVINNMIYALSGSEPAFDDDLYRRYTDALAGGTLAGQLSEAGVNLLDDAALSADLYSRLLSLKMSARQLAAMGATVAADGRNPYSGEYAFDGDTAQSVVAMMATHGKHFIKPWMMLTGVPARKSYAGGIVAVMPGFGAIAAYAPEVDERGLSVKAAQAVRYIANTLGLNVYASARVEVEK
ncbi:MAG: glutaminase [Muribaculaceae bacterium]|nr:glutaminase [Muribaculaceae bacterium]